MNKEVRNHDFGLVGHLLIGVFDQIEQTEDDSFPFIIGTIWSKFGKFPVPNTGCIIMWNLTWCKADDGVHLT